MDMDTIACISSTASGVAFASHVARFSFSAIIEMDPPVGIGESRETSAKLILGKRLSQGRKTINRHASV